MIELLIALGLASTILAALYATLYQALKSWKIMGARVELYQAGRVVLENLESDLQSVPAYGVQPFEGDRTSLRFSTLLEIGEEGTSAENRLLMGAISYQWKVNGTAGLTRRWQVYAPNGEENRLEGESVFPSLVSDLAFSYAVQESDKSVKWAESWMGQKVLPKAVKISLTLVGPESRRVYLEKIVGLPSGSWPVQ